MNRTGQRLDMMHGAMRIAGVDEVGRGSLAGPVMAAAVILHPDRPVAGLRDSKKLSRMRREQIDPLIRERAMAYAIGRTEVDEITDINILHASMLAMKRAIEQLSITPEHVLIDGNRAPPIALPVTTIIKGDDKEDSIAAASIIAKVQRDREMNDIHRTHPQYGFNEHKGYPTKRHIQAIKEHGITRHHRPTYRPVREAMQNR